MTNSDADNEQRCDAEQRNFPSSHFGVGPDGQFIHIKVRPNWNNPGQGHTMSGQDVWFEGRAVDFQQEWNLIKIWPRL